MGLGLQSSLQVVIHSRKTGLLSSFSCSRFLTHDMDGFFSGLLMSRGGEIWEQDDEMVMVKEGWK